MKVTSEHWKHYTLKVGGGRALAYLTHAQTKGTGPLAQAERKDDAAARAAVLEKLQQLEGLRTKDAVRDLTIPSTAEFVFAIGALAVSSPIQSMMRTLALADAQGVTATRLADTAGYTGYSAANLQLGKTAAQIGDMLGLRTDQTLDPEGRAAATFLIADEGPAEAATGNWSWIPRPSFAAAYLSIQGKSHG